MLKMQQRVFYIVLLRNTKQSCGEHTATEQARSGLPDSMQHRYKRREVPTGSPLASIISLLITGQMCDPLSSHPSLLCIRSLYRTCCREAEQGVSLRTSYRWSLTYDGLWFSPLQWCKSEKCSVETVLWILHIDLFLASDRQYEPSASRSWVQITDTLQCTHYVTWFCLTAGSCMCSEHI